MLEGSLIEVVPAQRFVIQRPRLTRLLDESQARIIVLLGPAGYGKTTLARQWMDKEGRKAVWVRADAASDDVAALAAQIAQAAEVVVPGCSASMVARLNAASSPSEDASLLGRMLAASLSAWPPDSWLVIDDYQHVAPGSGADGFVAALTTDSSIRLIVTSRLRPSWASPRRVLYDEVFVVDRQRLAFTRREALAVLAGVPARTAHHLLERSQGWPAVVRLAALSGRPTNPIVAEDNALYDYFAQELFDSAPSQVTDALLRLTPYPTLSAAIVSDVLGEHASTACERATSLGFLARYDRNTYELHPLLREFLEVKFAARTDADALVEAAFREVLAEGQWDDAHTIITRFNREELYDDLLELSLTTMVKRNRVATLSAWIHDATNRGLRSPLLDVASAEIDLRLGNFERALTTGLLAVGNLSEASLHLSRAYAIASECAHLLWRPEQALEYGRLAEATAQTEDDKRRAIWAGLITSVDSEIGDMSTYVSRLEEVADGSPESALRVLNARMFVTVFTEGVSKAFDEMRASFSLAERCSDVVVATSFEYRIAYTGVLAARYREALPLARAAAYDIDAAGLRFAIPRSIECLAALMIGLRRFRRAQRLIDRVAEELTNQPDVFTHANWHALKARLMLATRSVDVASEEATEGIRIAPNKAMRGELLGLLALASAAGNSPDDALPTADEALASTNEVQGVTLAHLARAISALRTTGASRARDELRAAEMVLEQRQNYDSLVYAARVYPPLLAALGSRNGINGDVLIRVLRNSKDYELADGAGLKITRDTNPRPLLTPRENEVFALMRTGLTNREIASELYITEATVKVHVRHILEKFGARSRTEEVVRFARY